MRPEDVSNDELTLSLCGPEQRAEQARLFNACFKKTLQPASLSWRYDQNPQGASVSLVARPPGGEGVCGYACNPRLALVRGDLETAAPVGQTGDVMTHPDWRKRGIFSSLDARCMEETAALGWPLVFGFPNRRSAHIFVKIGWDCIGTVRPWTWFPRATAPARAHRRREGRLRQALLPLAAQRCKSGRRRLASRAPKAADIRPLERFPEEVGALSFEVEQQFDFMVRRTADYLNWRFIDTSLKSHLCFGVFDEAGAMKGYVVVQPPREAGGVGFLVDVLAPDAEWRAAAIGFGVDSLVESGAAAIEATAVDGSFWARELRDAGFLEPRPENHLTVILYTHDATHPLAKVARDPSSWYFTDGDRDDETMG